MTSKINHCLDTAARQNHISQEEAEFLKKRYAEIRKQVGSDVDAKAGLIGEMEAEAANRKRVALITETVREGLVKQLEGYKNRFGETDMAEAYLLLHETFGEYGGTFLKSAANLEETLIKEYMGGMQDVLQEFRRGMVTGDRRRQGKWVGNKAVQARMDNFVRELFGETTGDDMAKALAEAWTKTAEALRLRFNQAGGMIGRLEKWGLPQWHNPEALHKYGQTRWVDYMMGDGVLDRERITHPLTKRKLSDDEMREALAGIWLKIATDGWSSKEVSGVPVGRGALWSQHADHRFLHFKDADAWMQYARDFGNPDPFNAMMGHIKIMSRDIAHMEVFGPNPNVMRSYIENLLRSRAAQVKPVQQVIKEQTAALKELAGKMTKPSPDYVRLSERIGQITEEMNGIRNKARWAAERRLSGERDNLHERLHKLSQEPDSKDKGKEIASINRRLRAIDTEISTNYGSGASKAHRKMMELQAEFEKVTRDLLPYWDDPSLQSVEDHAVAQAMEVLLDRMMDPITFANASDPGSYLNTIMHKADQRWDVMRGAANLPVNTRIANTMATIRNLLSAAMLPRAFFSSWTDAATGQDVRLRLGISFAKSNAWRVLPLALKETFTKQTRPEAVRSWLGWDGAMNAFQQSSRFVGTIDTRAWTGYVADRVLTTTLLTPYTQALKHLFGSDFFGYLADMRIHSWSDLPGHLQKALTRHGFDAGSWDQIRAAPIKEASPGVGWLEPDGIMQVAGRDLAERYAMMVHRETRMAVVEGTVASRAITYGDPPGALKGELMRSFMQFKGYPMAVVMLHGQRVMREVQAGDGVSGKMQPLYYFGGMILSGMLLAAVSMAFKDMSKGKDPRKWFDDKTYLDPAFWGAAFLQSAGLGIYGDFLNSAVSRTGKGFAETAAGPAVGFIEDVIKLAIGGPFDLADNAIRSIQGKATRPHRTGARAIRVAKQMTPSHWGIDIALQRVIFDQLQMMIDPEAHKSFRRQVARDRNANNQGYYWPPGEAWPQRAPDVSRVIQGR